MRLIPHPVLANYYLTYRCNASCSFCDLWEKPSPYASEEQVRANLEALKRLKVKVIDFTGGEPLLHRQAAEFFALAKSMNFITTLTTNTLLYPKHAEKLKGNVDMLHFSLDSVVPEKHNASRGVPCYDHLIKSIRIAKDLGERPDILFTIHDGNIHELEEAYEQFALKENLILILNPMFTYNGVGSDLSEAGVNELKQWRGKKNVYINDAFLDLRLNGGNKTSDPVCKAVSSTIVIGPENELILPCYHLGEKSISIDRPLDELWLSNEVQAWTGKEGRLPGCEGCTVNCYMEPSMAVETGKYFYKSLGSTLKYGLEKWVW